MWTFRRSGGGLVCLLLFCVRIRVVRSAQEGGVAARRKSFVSFSLVCLGGGGVGGGRGWLPLVGFPIFLLFFFAWEGGGHGVYVVWTDFLVAPLINRTHGFRVQLGSEIDFFVCGTTCNQPRPVSKYVTVLCQMARPICEPTGMRELPDETDYGFVAPVRTRTAFGF